MVPGKWIGSPPSVEAADIDVSKILAGVEDRYNRTQTLQLSFAESLTVQGHKRTEKGVLYLRKPGKMRWEYTAPAGKLFVSDGKYIYSYFPDERRAERMSFKETDDMRAPLAFLLGRLKFKDDFREFRSEPDRENVYITAIPKSDKLPYSEVTFLVSPDSVIHDLKVKGQDGSITEFVFENEKKNPPLSETLFHFIPPQGVEYEVH
jgi:outer membrane lipoprotein carrier protein